MQIRLVILVVITLTLLTISILFEAIPLYIPLLAASIQCLDGLVSTTKKREGNSPFCLYRGSGNEKTDGIFLLIGALIPAWSLSGVIDSMVYHVKRFSSRFTLPDLLMFLYFFPVLSVASVFIPKSIPMG